MPIASTAAPSLRSGPSKRVSVVVPTYNRAELLKATVRSILDQTLPPFEIIVVDDGSTDNTADVCAEFPPPVRYIRQDNRGVAAARNTALRAARGDWIAFCDSDDLWMPHKLELQLSALDVTGVSWSITDFLIIGPEGEIETRQTNGFQVAFPVFPEMGRTPEEHFARWLDGRGVQGLGLKAYTGDAFGMLFLGNVVIPSTALIARDLVTRVGFFDETLRVAEDTEYFHRVAAMSRVTILMKPLSLYRVGHASLVAQKSEQLIVNAILSVERAALLRPHLSLREQDALRIGSGMLRSRLAYSRLAALDREAARHALRDSAGKMALSPRSAAIFLMSWLPRAALVALHRVKRFIRGNK